MISLLIIMLVTGLINNDTHLEIILHAYQFSKTLYIKLSFVTIDEFMDPLSITTRTCLMLPF